MKNAERLPVIFVKSFFLLDHLDWFANQIKKPATTIDILNRAIKKGGSSIQDFKNITGKSGNFQKEFRVYQRENLSCLRNKCNGKIQKIFISNRSTFFCNTCQK